MIDPKFALLAACLVALVGCNSPANCSGGDYRGGCLAGPPAVAPVAAPLAARVTPPVATPVVAPAVAAPLAAPVRGDPAAFADVDDRQCRSYGLTFGSHDYAECRIRLSAQHRGLDPNTR